MPTARTNERTDDVEPTATPRHEPGRAAVPLVQIPRVLVNDQRLSLIAKGLVAEAIGLGGALDVAAAAARATESVHEILDAVDELVHRRYAVVVGDELVLTPIVGWAA